MGTSFRLPQAAPLPLNVPSLSLRRLQGRSTTYPQALALTQRTADAE
ncbi:MAG: hypothetical protein KA141_06820 [Rubrivivax sp.]|nr:hypothetical protein [Rubrivivax sp.]